MRPELETYHLIDQYHKGELHGDELRIFQERLSSDSEFASEVDFQAMVNEVVIGANIHDLRNQIANDIHKIDNSNNLKKWGLISISSILIGGGIAWGVASNFVDKNETHELIIKPSEITIVKNPDTFIQSQISEDQKSNEVSKSINKIEDQTNQTLTINQTTTSYANNLITSEDNLPLPQIEEPKSLQNNNGNLPEQTKALANPCSETNIKSVITVKDACTDKNDGKILIPSDKISGGEAPYIYKINNPIASISRESIAGLASGNYEVTIIDKNGCIQKSNIIIGEKFCNPKSYIIAPDKGEVWKYQGLHNEYFTVSILTQSGRQVFQQNNNIGLVEWNGISQQGENIEPGLYIYIVEYTNGTKDNGQITIVK